MKKFLPSLFLLALWCTGASADLQVSTDESSPEYIYTIRGGGINTSYFWSSTGANVYFASSARFAFYKKDSDTEEVYYIYSVTDNTYLSYDNTSFSASKNQAKSVSSKADANPWKISECTYNNASYFQLQPLDASGNAVDFYANWVSTSGGTTSIGLWSAGGSSNPGSAWTFSLVEDISYTISVDGQECTGTAKGFANTEIHWSGADLVTFSDASWSSDGKTYTATATLSDKYIRVQSSGQSYLFADASKIRMDANTLPTNESGVNDKYKWTFIPCFDGSIVTYKIRNNNGKYISTTGVTLSSPSSHLPLADEGTAFSYGTCIGSGYGFYVPGTTNYISINSPGGTGQYMFLWSKTGSSHTGSNLTFETPADFDALMTSLTAAKTTADSYTVGTAPGQYTATDDFTAAKTKAAAIIGGTTYATAAEFTTYTDNLSLSNLTLNVPQAGKFYTFQETTTSQYLTPKMSTVTNYTNRLAVEKDGDEADRIFYFDGTNLMGYSNGYYLANNGVGRGFLCQASVGATSGTEFTFVSGDNTESSLCVNFNNNGRGLYGARDGYVDASGANTKTDGHRFYVCEVTDLPLTIGTNGWATFSAPVAVTVPDGVTAYYAPSAPDDGKLVLEEVTGAIPANTGIIVRGTEGKTVNFSTVTTDTEEATVSGNLLQSNVSVNSIEGASGDGKYALATNTTVTPKVTGFMKLNTTITLPGHKCWLQTSTSASSGKFLPLALTDDPTGIETAETAVSDSDAPVYDLQGRKVASTRKGGMYIQNGKVFIAM